MIAQGEAMRVQRVVAQPWVTKTEFFVNKNPKGVSLIRSQQGPGMSQSLPLGLTRQRAAKLGPPRWGFGIGIRFRSQGCATFAELTLLHPGLS